MHPLIRITLSFAAGILVGRTFLFFPWTSLAASLLLAVLAVRSVRRTGRLLTDLLLPCSGAIAGGLATVIAIAWLPLDHYTRHAQLDGSGHVLIGTVASPLDRGPQRTAFHLDLESLDGTVLSGRLRATLRDTRAPIGYGDRVAVFGRLYPPRGTRNPGGFDLPAHLSRQGIHGTVSIRRDRDITVIDRGHGPLRQVQDLRERIRQSFLRSTTGDGSAVLLAMVLGEEGNLTDDLRERFMAAGVTHILSISGSHLGLVAVLCFWACRQMLFLLPERRYHWLTLRLDPKKVAAVLTIVPVTFYAFLAGGQVATMRALIMIVTGLTAVLLDRDGDLLSAFALAALFTLIPNPRALFDLSFQLSYLSVITILFVVDTWRQLQFSTAQGSRKWLLNGLLLLVISSATTLATGPLVVHHFRQVSLAGVIANMVVVPFAGAVVVPLGLLSGVLSLVLDSLPFAAVNQTAADGFVSLVSFFSALPLAAVRLGSPGPMGILGSAGLLVAGALWSKAWILSRYQPLAFPSRSPSFVPVLAGLSLTILCLAAALGFARQGVDRVTFLDVGQGDCVLVQTAGGRSILIDGGGTRDNRFDVGRRIVAPYLWDRGIGTIDLVVLSHPHPDHLNGLLSLVGPFPVRELWWSGSDGGLEGFDALRRLAADRRSTVRAVSTGHHAVIGDAVVDVLHPDPGMRQRERTPYAAENDRSLVVRLGLGGSTFLFTGDIHRDAESALLRQHVGIRADVVKVPHHGSKSSSSDAFIRAVLPSMAVISVGAGNPYRHPADDVVERYETAGAAVLRTDRNGAVIVRDRSGALTAICWSDLMLQAVDPARVSRWGEEERMNWERLWLRTTAI